MHVIKLFGFRSHSHSFAQKLLAALKENSTTAAFVDKCTIVHHAETKVHDANNDQTFLVEVSSTNELAVRPICEVIKMIPVPNEREKFCTVTGLYLRTAITPSVSVVEEKQSS